MSARRGPSEVDSRARPQSPSSQIREPNIVVAAIAFRVAIVCRDRQCDNAMPSTAESGVATDSMHDITQRRWPNPPRAKQTASPPS